MTILINILLGFYVFVALLMVLVILMQRPKSEGLGAAFGGGVTENIFGAQTTNVLTKITGWLAAIFFLLTFVLSILYAHKGNTPSGLRRELMKDLPPPVTVTGSPTPTPGASPIASPSASSTPTATAPAASVTPAAAPAASITPAAAAASPIPSPMSSVAPVSTPMSSVSPASSPDASAEPSAPRRRRRH
jgi:preprotein translocase subunit SecG